MRDIEFIRSLGCECRAPRLRHSSIQWSDGTRRESVTCLECGTFGATSESLGTAPPQEYR